MLENYQYLPVGDYAIFYKEQPPHATPTGLLLPSMRGNEETSLTPPYTGRFVLDGGEKEGYGVMDALSGYALLSADSFNVTIAMDRKHITASFSDDISLDCLTMENGYILIKDKERPKQSPAGLWLPDGAYQRIAEVVAVPDDCTDLKAGDVIVKPVGLSTPVEIYGEKYECIHRSRIFAKLGKEDGQ